MTLSFTDWAPDDVPGELLDVSSDDGWSLIRERYTGTEHTDAPLERIIEIAKAHGVVTVLIEYRYVDADWRSEHSAFYGTTFRRYPSVCHRLHLFTTGLPADLGDLSDYADAYRGFVVVRPLPYSPVGRTMITPPPEMAGAIVTTATESVNIFGWDFTVTAMPFVSQDSQYLRCAHASIWMLLRHASLFHGLPRRLPGEIREACVGGNVVGRQLPSEGLSVAQMLDGLSRLGMSVGRLDAPPRGLATDPAIPGALTLYGILCRYINSDLPPIVVSHNHAWVIVAWARQASAGHSKLTLWRHDDAAGPYIRVDDPWNEPDTSHQPWAMILPPLLPKMNIDAERAEATGAAWTSFMLQAWGEGDAPRGTAALANGELTFRTFAVSSNSFKRRLSDRGVQAELARLYRTTPMPRYVWIIEVVDRVARQQGKPDVVGEVILDATHTASRRIASAGILAAHIEKRAFTRAPDHATVQVLELDAEEPYLGDRDART